MADFLGDRRVGERGLWGYTAQDLASQEAQRKEGVAAGEARGTSEAFSSIMQRAAAMRDEFPDLSPDMLFRKMLSDPTFLQSALRVPAGQMHSMVSNVIGSLYPRAESRSCSRKAQPCWTRPAGAVSPASVLPAPGGRRGWSTASAGAGDELYRNPKTFAPEETADVKQRAAHGAALMQKIYEDSQAATLDRPRLEQLREIAAKNPGGVTTWLRGFLADKGINVAGKSDLDMWSAMVNQAAPRTREPGSASSPTRISRLQSAAFPTRSRARTRTSSWRTCFST